MDLCWQAAGLHTGVEAFHPTVLPGQRNRLRVFLNAPGASSRTPRWRPAAAGATAGHVWVLDSTPPMGERVDGHFSARWSQARAQVWARGSRPVSSLMKRLGVPDVKDTTPPSEASLGPPSVAVAPRYSHPSVASDGGPSQASSRAPAPRPRSRTTSPRPSSYPSCTGHAYSALPGATTGHQSQSEQVATHMHPPPGARPKRNLLQTKGSREQRSPRVAWSLFSLAGGNGVALRDGGKKARARDLCCRQMASVDGGRPDRGA